MSKVLILISFIFSNQLLWSQSDTVSSIKTNSRQETIPSLKIYNGHPKWEIPVSIALISAASLGYKEMDKKASLTESQVLALDLQSINSFDRPAAYYDPAGFQSAQSKSDILMVAASVSPLLLVFDKKMKRDRADLLGMLLLAQAIDNSILFSGFLAVRRPRPLAYNPELSIDAKTEVGKTNSFFSGHVSWAAVSTFFIAKVYTDYHHIKGWKRILIYTGAAIPPSLVGYYRVHAGRHFESDAIAGVVIGAACGIVIPELHKIKLKDKGISVQPFYKLGANGVSVSYIIK